MWDRPPATTHLVSVEEYLHTSFEHDAEYVEGRIVYRSVPKKPHSKMQAFLLLKLHGIGRPLGYKVWPEQRIRTKASPARYRVPDLCVTFGEPDEDVFTDPPYLCIEILSPDDLAAEVSAKADEYLALGVPYVWVVDPVSLNGETRTRDGIERVSDGRFRAGVIEVDLQELRAAMC
jgi:Uma2 family endonuclease